MLLKPGFAPAVSHCQWPSSNNAMCPGRCDQCTQYSLTAVLESHHLLHTLIILIHAVLSVKILIHLEEYSIDYIPHTSRLILLRCRAGNPRPYPTCPSWGILHTRPALFHTLVSCCGLLTSDHSWSRQGHCCPTQHAKGVHYRMNKPPCCKIYSRG